MVRKKLCRKPAAGALAEPHAIEAEPVLGSLKLVNLKQGYACETELNGTGLLSTTSWESPSRGFLAWFAQGYRPLLTHPWGSIWFCAAHSDSGVIVLSVGRTAPTELAEVGGLLMPCVSPGLKTELPVVLEALSKLTRAAS
jgi:hypothetical protein